MKRITLFFVLLLTAQILVFAQKYPYPMEIEVKIAASFAEMRDNHFHMGLDMSTFNQENKPIHAVADGYVSRVSVSPYGYGRAVYINHPDGHTTVYGHMNAFCGEIDKAVRKAQYEKESFNVDLTFAPDEIPVKKWDVIALSGNTGGSQAPHLHFEVRDTETELALNPLAFMVDIPDNVKPEVSGIKVYATNDTSQVSLLCKDKYFPILQIQNKTINVYGQIGLGADVIDRFITGSNRCGVVNTRLYDNGKLIFESNLDSISFDDTRYINSYFDFADRKKNSRYVQKSFIDTYNQLRNVYKTCKSNITVNEGETHRIKYEFRDFKGNLQVLEFSLLGKKSPTATPRTHTGYLVKADSDWTLEAHGFHVLIPRMTTYRNEYIPVIVDTTNNKVTVGNTTIPAHTAFKVRMPIKPEYLQHKDKVFAIHANEKGRTKFVSSEIHGDSILIKSREFGTFSLGLDTVPPTATSRNTSRYLRSIHMISVSPSDNLTGITDWDAYIDNEWKPFEYDYKKNRLIAYVKDLNLTAGKHQLVMKLYDAVGNEGVFKWDFWVR